MPTRKYKGEKITLLGREGGGGGGEESSIILFEIEKAIYSG